MCEFFHRFADNNEYPLTQIGYWLAFERLLPPHIELTFSNRDFHRAVSEREEKTLFHYANELISTQRAEMSPFNEI